LTFNKVYAKLNITPLLNKKQHIMTYFDYIARIFIATLSLCITSGVAVHDSHVEHVIETAKQAKISKLTSLDVKAISEARTPHTHSDHDASSSMLSHSFTYQSPSMAPDRRHHHKRILAVLEEGGRHAFDNANLPILD